MKVRSTLILALAGLAFSGGASAQFAKVEDAIKYRKSTFFVLGQHFTRVANMANGKAPFDAKAAAENAAVVETMSHLAASSFVEGSDVGETRAKADIWKEQAKFNQIAEKFKAETGKLAAAAKTGNLDSIKVAVQATAGTCKSCHDDFRSK